MRFLLQSPLPDRSERLYNLDSDNGAWSLWVVLHGAAATAEQGIGLLGQEATERKAFLLAPEATRPCGEGFCWSFAHDAEAIVQEIQRLRTLYPIDAAQIAVIGYSMGCTMGAGSSLRTRSYSRISRLWEWGPRSNPGSMMMGVSMK